MIVSGREERKCPKCNNYKGRSDFSKNKASAPSLDRRDQTKGYTKDNVRVVVACFNIGRGVWSDDTISKVMSAFLIERHPPDPSSLLSLGG